MDQNNLQIYDNISTYAGDHQCIKDIQFFHKTYAQTAAQFRKHKHNKGVDTDQGIVTSSPEGVFDLSAVAAVPGCGKNSRDGYQEDDSQ